MSLSLQEIRAKLKAQEEAAKGNSKPFNTEPQAFLAHWNIAEGAPLNLRFLEDSNQDNPYFWREREMITLSFSGVKGGDQKPTTLVVPCNEIWSGTNSCPVTKELREWYKAGDQALADRARAYWKKKSYIMQCFIAPNSTKVIDDLAPENPIRRVLLSKKLFNAVKSILLNPNVEYMPTDVDRGRDFSIIKGKQGQYASYDQSQWSFAERPLNEEERSAIKTFGLFNLDDFMPKQPSEDHLRAIAEMFEASVNEEQYDPARWAEFYRPSGVQTPQTSAHAATIPAPQTQQTPVAEQIVVDAHVAQVSQVVQEPVHEEPKVQAPDPVKATKTSTADLLAKLKASKG